MKDRYLFLIFCFSAMGMFAQETEGFSIPNYAAKTPEAAAFLKYGEYPVNLSTGVPNISIPLYTIQIPGYSLPITLDYHASGIQVDQESSWVGLGWNVNYGAQIILSARDEVDENNSRIDDMPMDSEIDYYDAHPFAFNEGPIVSEEFGKSRVKDVYQFSSPTASGQFYIRDGSTSPSDIVVYPPDAFKVEAINGIYDQPASGRERFKVTDPQGNVYIFRTSERSYRKETHHDFYKSAWYVDEIRTPNNQAIYFTYEDDGVTAEHSLVQKADVVESQIDCNCPNTEDPVQYDVTPIMNQGGTTYTYVKRIKEITFNNGNSKVVFNRVNDRQDLKSGIFDVATNYSISRLNSLEVRHRSDASTGTFNLVKGYSFHQGYFNADEAGTDAYKHKRLRLDRVMTLLEGDAHEFVYNTEHDLPEKGSFSKDIYGYYNGATNYNLIPPHDVPPPFNETVGSADRRVDPFFNQVGILKEIHYPAKGWTKFHYETNQFYGSYNNEGLENHASIHGAAQGVGPGGLNPVGQEETDPGPGDPYTSQCQDPDICVRYYTIPFNVGSGTVASINAVLTNSTPTGQTPYQHMYGRVRIFNGSSTPVYDSGSPRYLSWNETVDNISLNGSGIIVIEAWGEYIHMAAGVTFFDPSPKNINAGGLRVASIENYDHDGSLLLKKIYDYNLPSNPNKTSGISVSGNVGFNFTSERIESYVVSNCPNPDPGGIAGNFIPKVDYNYIYSISSEGKYGISGNAIVYQYVTEKQVDASDNTLGYTLYKFTTGTDTYVNPTVPITTPWKRGKLLEKSVYKIVNGNDFILQKEENTYVEDNAKVSYINGFQMRRFAYVPIGEHPDGPFVEPHGYVPECGMPPNVNTMVSFQKYNIGFPWYYLSDTKITNYYYNNQNNLTGTFVTNTDYVYSNPVHLQLSKTITTTSDGKTLETRLYYPGDVVVQSEPNVASLIAKNIFGTPLKTQTYLNGSKLQEQKTKYKSWPTYDPNVTMLLPEIIQGAKENDALENRIVFVQRDKAGNPVEVKLENGVSVCYIWAYNDSQVVAKIENATYAGISSTLVQNIKDTSVTGTEGDLIAQLNQLRLQLPNAMVTTYTYLPLIGISTITDPRGYKTAYELDNQSRLRFVKDQEDNILLENQYHYKN